MKASGVENMLPIGSVVTLQGGTKKVMIVGRFQHNPADNRQYAYSAVYYPEGMLNTNELFLFDQEDILGIYFQGYKCLAETEFKQFAIEQLKKKNLLEPEEEPQIIQK